ncbi:MAG: uracil-DNA glycosylase family protein [Candidatus Heimdallarchaeota archaeon]
MRENEFWELRDQVASCFKCGLHTEGIHPIFGEGRFNAKVIFIGEAPGATENRLTRPFVGASGNVLNEFLEKIGLSRNDVFITNIVKCRPPNNRDPTTKEINVCSPYLLQQIRMMHAQIVVTLGRFAAGFFLSHFKGMNEIVGRVHSLENHQFSLLPMFHPATALYSRHRYLPIFERDFLTLKDFLERKNLLKEKQWGYEEETKEKKGLDRFFL